MKSISNAELALISLIAEQPRHAYEIEQVIEVRNIRQWTELGFSSIYRILSKMEMSGWLEGTMQPPKGRGPARKVYQLTKIGRKVWQQAALASLANPDRKYSSFLLGLDNLCALPQHKAQEAIQTYLHDQRAIYQTLRTAVDQHPLQDDFCINNFFSYMLEQMASEIKWLEGFSSRLENYYQQSNKK